MLVFLVIGWEESGLQRWLYQELLQNEVVLLKSQGDNWQVWDKSTVLHEDYQCHWVNYGRRGQVCAAKSGAGDDVSDEIAKRGFSQHCRGQIRQQWNKNHPNRNYVEIGGGSDTSGSNLLATACAMEMLLTTEDAKVIVLDSRPESLFRLTSTLLKYPKFLDRVTVIPVALLEPSPSTSDAAAATTKAETVDEVLRLAGGAQLVHIHPTGHECEILQGMPVLLAKTHQVHFHFDAERAKDCSPLSVLKNQKFKMSRFQGLAGRLRSMPSTPSTCYVLARNKNLQR